jgi:hypothetical protein
LRWARPELATIPRLSVSSLVVAEADGMWQPFRLMRCEALCRLFSPLAFTKTFSMAAAAILSLTLVPALMILFV